ncbi:hypothetical protein [Haladaptatus halobius]|uniref:hypothetical protein n=1 Tax=Haladaptatus halobius TaxID=2884875 RepID=UPI00210394F5|nr:hypothetical protein [Haladaptatus halobius]
MKYLRLTGTPEPERVPRVFSLWAGGSHVTETRLCDWNLADSDSATILFEIDGDVERIRGGLADVSGVIDAVISRITDDRFYLLVRFRVSEIPLMRAVFPVLTRLDLVVVKPIVYRDGHRLPGRTSTRVHRRNRIRPPVRGRRPPAERRRRYPRRRRVRRRSGVARFDAQRTPARGRTGRSRTRVLRPPAESHARGRGRTTGQRSEHLQKGEAKLLETVLRAESDAVSE